jgi:hypothetical protein
VVYVLPLAYFAAEDWWPGKKIIEGNKLVSNKVSLLSKQIDPIVYPLWEIEGTQ